MTAPRALVRHRGPLSKERLVAAPELSEHDWEMRLFIYQHFIANAVPPTDAQAADHFGIPATEARASFHRLHDRHALFLTPGTDAIRIANPLSAVPTDYIAHADGHRLIANCAWDSLGIPAMLHTDARIDAVYTHVGTPARYAIVGGKLEGDDGVVHFPLPFRHWYDDLIHT
jgi:hypothetical protein